MGKKVERKMYWEELPRWEDGRYKGNIKWENTIGRKCRFVYSSVIGEIEIINYTSIGQKLGIKMSQKDIFYIGSSDFKRCKIGNLLRIKTGEFKMEIGTNLKDEKRDLTITDREYRHRKDHKGNNKYYKYTCNKCKWTEGWIVEGALIGQGVGCSCCCPNPQIIVQGINDMFTTAYWMVELGVDENFAKTHTRSSGEKAPVICPDCGDGFSQGHKYVHNILTQLATEFKQNQRLKWCKYPSYKDINRMQTGEYDFVIEDKKLIIEVDGGWHRIDNKMSGQTKEHSKYLDDMKDLRAKENDYKVIRIDTYNCDIKDNILNSELSKIFDLSKIDWKKVGNYAMINLSKLACDLFNENTELTNDCIGSIIGVSRGTVNRWLIQWEKLGLCSYDPKESVRKGVSKSGKRRGVLIEVFKDGISKGIFDSGMEIERQSEKLFGFKLSHVSISNVVNGKQDSCKGYTFKYAS